MPQNLDSGAKIGLATFVATSVGFGPQGREGGGRDSNPRPLGSESRVLNHWAPGGLFPWGIVPQGDNSPGESFPWGITPPGETPLGNRPPGESSPWETPPGESSPRGIIPLGETPLGNRLPGESFPWETPPGGSSPRGIIPLGETPWGIVPQGNHSHGRDPLGNRGADGGASTARARPAVGSADQISEIQRTLKPNPPEPLQMQALFGE